MGRMEACSYMQDFKESKQTSSVEPYGVVILIIYCFRCGLVFCNDDGSLVIYAAKSCLLGLNLRGSTSATALGWTQ